MRVYLSRQAERELEGWRTVAHQRAQRLSPHMPNQDDSLTFMEMIQPSRDSDIIFEFVPKVRARFKGVLVNINSQGFRGGELAPIRAPGTLRILGLGDSVMFGWGVPEGATFLEQLGRLLSDGDHGVRIEVINTAVPAYNTATEVATLEHKGLRLKPDLVVLHFVGNDFMLPNFIVPETDYWAFDRLFTLDMMGVGRADDLRPSGLVPAPHSEDWRFPDDPDSVPAQYRHMVGMSGFKRAMRRLSEMAAQEGFEILVTYQRTDLGVQAVLEEFGIPGLCLIPAINAALSERGLEDYATSPLVLSPQDTHPSPLGHRVIAEAIYQHLQTGSLSRLIKSAQQKK